MKASTRKIASKLRGDKRRVTPASIKKKITPRLQSKEIARAPAPDVTGQTVFDDRPLRFRSLTVNESDLSSLEGASAIEGAFKIRLAKRTGAHRDARALVERRYEGRGYTIAGRKPRPNVLTFIAYDEGQIVGTVGLGISTNKGLSADELYRAEIDRLRATGCQVCEFTRLAVDRTAASKPVLAGLFQTAYLYAALIRGYTHAVIEVNPRHVTFYGKSLKFEPLGPERLNTRVNAPAVLLCASFETIAEGLRKYAGKSPAPGTKRTLFHYGFSPAEEVGVLTRLRELISALDGRNE